MVTLQSAENALKTVYIGAITDLLNTRTNPLLAKIEHTSADVWGKEIKTAARVGLTGGVGAGDEAGSLPVAYPTKYIQFTSTLKNLYGRIEISDKAIRASANGQGAFTDLLNAELEGLLNASKFNLGRMMFGDGSGLLSTVIDTMGEMTLVTDVRNFMAGMVVDVYNHLDEEYEMGVRVEYVDYAGGAAKFINRDGSLTEMMSDLKIFAHGSKDKEITGLDAIFNTAKPLYGIDRTVSPYLNPHEVKGQTDISEVLIQKTIDEVENNSASVVNYLACAANVKYAYQNYMLQYKQNIDVMELEGGYKTMSYNGIPLIHERFVAPGMMYFLDTNDFKMHQLCDWRYLETENGKILRQNEGKPTFSATLVKYCDLICARPNGQARLSKIKCE